MPQKSSLDVRTVIQVASEIVDSEGLESLSLAVVAQKLHIRSPSLYNHVHGLQDLRVKLAVHGCNLLHSVMTTAAIGRSGDVAVRAMAEQYLAFARMHPGLYDAIQRVPDPQEPEWREAAEQLVNTVVQVFKHYGLDDEACIHAVRGFRSVIHGFTSLERTGSFGMPIDVDESYRFLIEAYLAGLHHM